MIKKCDFKNCKKAGTYRSPKDRDLKSYWHFCQEHAAKYNKNWNYYENMSPEEVEKDWEEQTFGAPLQDKEEANIKAADYTNFINDFLTGRNRFDHISEKKSVPSKIIQSFKILKLPSSASWTEISAMYRALAKKHHPDTSKDKEKSTDKFAQISQAYKNLELISKNNYFIRYYLKI